MKMLGRENQRIVEIMMVMYQGYFIEYYFSGNLKNTKVSLR